MSICAKTGMTAIPGSCAECVFGERYGLVGDMYCKILGEYFTGNVKPPHKMRPDECPLVELPASMAAQPNGPLTLEDTLTMHGEPAYLCWPDGGEWVLIRVASMEKVELVHRNGILAPIRFVLEGGGKLYRRPPKEGQ